MYEMFSVIHASLVINDLRIGRDYTTFYNNSPGTVETALIDQGCK